MIAIAHPLGHFLVARRHGVACSLPYFVPQLALLGTSGAFVKVRWPIASRAALIRIFAAGPLAGVTLSVLAILIGLPLSQIVDTLDPGALTFDFGDSLLAAGLERLLVGDLGDDRDILLSPIAWAGWVGLHLNFWHLLPVGRFDGGRIAVAALGWRGGVVVSVASIAAVLAYSVHSPAWLGLAAMGGLSHIRLRPQYALLEPVSYHPREAVVLGLALVALLILLFPARLPNFRIA
jgi:membrane-associated protease RseP (regulator of RpoE activity)